MTFNVLYLSQKCRHCTFLSEKLLIKTQTAMKIKDNRIRIKTFTGELFSPFNENKTERNFNNAALRAYLKGDDYFFFGRTLDGERAKHFVPKRYVKNPLFQ